MRRKPPLVTALSVALSSVLCLALPNGGLAQQAADRASQPVVVELFTSQGCSSCPPADAVLKNLAQRPDVIALALHVDYWDYIGWKDFFASPSNTDRQKGYAQVNGRRMIYTPQMIVMGQQDVSGNDVMGLAEAISAYQARPRPVALALQRQGGRLTVTVAPQGALPQAPIAIQLVRYTALETVDITRGELAGRQIDYANIVNDFQQVAIWDGQQTTAYTVDYDGAQPAAILVQQGPFGPVLAAAQVE
jgi:hypothetical protein